MMFSPERAQEYKDECGLRIRWKANLWDRVARSKFISSTGNGAERRHACNTSSRLTKHRMPLHALWRESR